MATSSDTHAESPRRELAAIMFSDITGYSAIMGRDEDAAMRALSAHRELLRSLLPQFNGRMLGEIGDGTLSGFHSAVDAVNCAREVQGSLRNDPELKLRIGIHVGDVVFTNDTALGDGVNVASRIHSLAPPGGICISERVYDEIRNKPEFQVKDLGEQKLKNVSRPLRAYALLATRGTGARRSALASIASEPRLGRRRGTIAAGIGALLVAAALIYGIESKRLFAPASVGPTAFKAGEIRSIAVLPLDNLSGDPSQEYFADGMTDELITDLAKISTLRVISRTSVMQFKGEHRKSLPEIAKALNVDAVVEGSVLRVGDKVRITAQLIDARADKHLWAESYERDSRDVLALQDELASAITGQINADLTPDERQRLAAAKPINPDALDAYLKGRYYLLKVTRDGFQNAKQSYERAIKIDPNFGPGYAGLGWWYVAGADVIFPPKEAMPKGRELLEQARRLDDSLAITHSGLATIDRDYDYDWAAAERENRRAIALAPGDADAHHTYGTMLLFQGRFEEAEQELKLAQVLSPLEPIQFWEMGRLFMFRAQYQKAIEQYRRALQIDPNFWLAHSFLCLTYDLMGDHGEALKEAQKAVALEPAIAIGMLGWEYARMGNREQARKVIEQLNRLSSQIYVSPHGLAVVYVALGEKKTALDLLEKAYQERSGSLCVLKLDPGVDSLRSDPRFIALLKKVGLDK